MAHFFVRNGEGEKFDFAGQSGCWLVHPETTSDQGRLAAAVITGPKGAGLPLHQHSAAHECLVVMAGKLDFQLGRQLVRLTPGDFVSVPPGTAHAYTMQSHRTSFLSWSVGSDAVTGVEDTKFLPPGLIPEAGDPGKIIPDGVEPYALEAGEGERMLAGDQLFAFLAHNKSTGGGFISLTTQGPQGERIPKHFHEKHTENFFCLEGRMTMWVGDAELTLHPGDFLHAPPGTIHAFRLDAPHNNFLGILTPGIFEPFFRTLCDPYEGYTYPAVPAPPRFDRVIAKLGELDLKLVERPGPPGR